MSYIPSAFSTHYDADAEKQAPEVPILTMHEFLNEIAEFINTNSSSENIECLQPEVLQRIAKVLEKRHKEGWSLETDYAQQLNLQ